MVGTGYSCYTPPGTLPGIPALYTLHYTLPYTTWVHVRTLADCDTSRMPALGGYPLWRQVILTE